MIAPCLGSLGERALTIAKLLQLVSSSVLRVWTLGEHLFQDTHRLLEV